MKLIRLGENETLVGIVSAEAVQEDDDFSENDETQTMELTEALQEDGLLEE